MRTLARGDIVRLHGRVGVVWHVQGEQFRYLPILSGRQPAHRADIRIEHAAIELKSPAIRCADLHGAPVSAATVAGHVSASMLAILLLAVSREAAARAAENGLHYALRSLTGGQSALATGAA